MRAKEFMLKYRLAPSDALHAATIVVNGLQAIASEDRNFDKVGIKASMGEATLTHVTCLNTPLKGGRTGLLP